MVASKNGLKALKDEAPTEFKLTLDEKRQILANRIKDIEVQRYNAEISLEILQGMKGIEGVDIQREQEQLKVEQCDRVLGELVKLHSSLDETEVSL